MDSKDRKICCPNCGATDKFEFDSSGLTIKCCHCEMEFILDKFIPNYDKIEEALVRNGRNVTDEIRRTLFDDIQDNIDGSLRNFFEEVYGSLRYNHCIKVDFSVIFEQLDEISETTKDATSQLLITKEQLQQHSKRYGKNFLELETSVGSDGRPHLAPVIARKIHDVLCKARISNRNEFILHLEELQATSKEVTYIPFYGSVGLIDTAIPFMQKVSIVDFETLYDKVVIKKEGVDIVFNILETYE
ncbi:MAG: hypothetical protein FWD49_02470 [Firmicutes bacterium]|nr:hypothetical protein [Bacillota bacterium]